ncbi:branched-chain amino acid ABC transporter permease [Devosia sp. FKR38]|uniref:branched-chain amino acid ABC transporter permease n=1 Tax=Devosia sp. FKR38 TaxID=2562312 RepID=UPI0010BFBDA1|nr:branched-chain amino acid ABC transporter permease [Devosia sp. FKR38]
MVEILLNGIFIGSLYALFGIGLALTLGLMRQINLAHGDLIVLSAYAALEATRLTGLHPLIVMPVVVVGMYFIGWALQRVLIERVMGRGETSPLLITFGLSMVLQSAMQLAFTADTASLDPGFLGPASVQIGPLTMGLLPIITFGVSVGVFALTAAVFNATNFGRSVRATADDARTATLMGIDTKSIFSTAMGLSIAVSAVAAIFFGMRGTFGPFVGGNWMLYAFETVILGGLGSIWGTFAGGLILGVSQALGGMIQPSFAPLLGHIVFLVVLLVRPRGLFAK